ncbi:MAG: hypothetical protein ACE5KM_22745 [Planctomycetaceae bacterium]
MHVLIKTPGSHVEKWPTDDGFTESDAAALGRILGAALYALGPTRLDEVLGHCIELLANHQGFGEPESSPAGDAVKDLCDAAIRIVEEWQRHDLAATGSLPRR